MESIHSEKGSNTLTNLDPELLAYLLKNDSLPFPWPKEFPDLAMKKFPGLFLDALMDAGKIQTTAKCICIILKVKEKPKCGFPWNQIDRLRGMLINGDFYHEKHLSFQRASLLLSMVENAMTPWLVQANLSH